MESTIFECQFQIRGLRSIQQGDGRSREGNILRREDLCGDQRDQFPTAPARNLAVEAPISRNSYRLMCLD